ncbi:hypothetical protein J4437_07515 [Candidatus Woesearchaeota archaeon]|nr:hypothetical protein [uncultured archaeon]MBS3124446.1 hypothetical protein [Candidatus Woesearchaeota archaeon]
MTIKNEEYHLPKYKPGQKYIKLSSFLRTEDLVQFKEMHQVKDLETLSTLGKRVNLLIVDKVNNDFEEDGIFSAKRVQYFPQALIQRRPSLMEMVLGRAVTIISCDAVEGIYENGRLNTGVAPLRSEVLQPLDLCFKNVYISNYNLAYPIRGGQDRFN